MTAGHRLFAALVPPPQVVEALEEFWSVRRAAGAFRWTGPEQWHVTLAFMPSVPDHLLDDLVDRLAEAAGRRTPFGLEVAGGGAFPNPAAGKVLWAGVRGVDAAAQAQLERLAVGARSAATAAGAEVEGGRFRPHLTLARTGRPAELTRWIRLAEAFPATPWQVEHVSLVASHLGEGPRRRPRYEVLAEVELQPG